MKVAFRKGVTYCVAGELKYRLPQRALTLGERLFVILPRNDLSREAERGGLGTETDRSSRPLLLGAGVRQEEIAGRAR